MGNRAQAVFSVNGKPIAGEDKKPEIIEAEVVVNNARIPSHVIAAEVQNHDAPKGRPAVAWRKAARAIVIRTLLLQEARARGIQAHQEEVAPGRFETKEEALIRGLLDAAIDVSVPSEDEIHAEWARNPSRFRSPPLWEASHILFACDPRDQAARDQAYAQAAQVTKKVLENPYSFASLAESNSDCGSKTSGGALGQLGPGDTVPEFEAVLRELSDGEITHEPVLTRHGWHIIRMDAVAEGAELPFEAVREKISNALEKVSWAKASKDFINQLTASAEVSGIDLNAE